jgi:predicted GNAT family acetyltransferase
MEDIVDNEALGRLEWRLEDGIAFMEYKRSAGRITLAHTEVPLALRHQGLGTALAEKILRYVEAKGWKAVVLCTFLQDYIRKHPHWERVLDKRVKVKGFNT